MLTGFEKRDLRPVLEIGWTYGLNVSGKGKRQCKDNHGFLIRTTEHIMRQRETQIEE